MLPRTEGSLPSVPPQQFFEWLFQSHESRNYPFFEFLNVTVPYFEKALNSGVLWFSSAPCIAFIRNPTGVVWTDSESAACNANSASAKGNAQKSTTLKGRFVVSKVQDAHCTMHISEQHMRSRLTGFNHLETEQTLTLTLRRTDNANEHRGTDITRSLILASDQRKRFHDHLCFDAYDAAFKANQDHVADYLSRKCAFE